MFLQRSKILYWENKSDKEFRGLKQQNQFVSRVGQRTRYRKYELLTKCDKRSLHASMNIVVKTHENVGVVSSYLSGYLSTSWNLLNGGQPATEF